MKKVAGKLKLSLAQFRELEAFAQFGSDLDQETKNTLDLGRRMTEILKQGQYMPYSLEKQVTIMYAVNNGYMNTIPVEKMAETEERPAATAKMPAAPFNTDHICRPVFPLLWERKGPALISAGR